MLILLLLNILKIYQIKCRQVIGHNMRYDVCRSVYTEILICVGYYTMLLYFVFLLNYLWFKFINLNSMYAIEFEYTLQMNF